MSSAIDSLRRSNYCYRIVRQVSRKLGSSLHIFEGRDARCDCVGTCQLAVFSDKQIESTFASFKQMRVGLMEWLAETKLGSRNNR